MQYLKSPRLLALIDGFNSAIDPEAWLQGFYSAVVDLDTAQGWGLDVWGRIVGVGRTLEVPDAENPLLGFTSLDYAPFNHGTFFNGESVSDTYILADDAFRLLIRIKAAVNISNGTLAQLNSILAQMFAGRGSCMILHTGTMQVRLVFEFALQAWERAILLNEAISPIPVGVGVELLEVVHPYVGFDGSGFMPFNQGTFFHNGFISGGDMNAQEAQAAIAALTERMNALENMVAELSRGLVYAGPNTEEAEENGAED